MSFSSTPPSPRPGATTLVCTHKNTARCVLTLPGCCACSDLRPHAPSYFVFVDGVGSVPQGTRWNSYCHHCKAYWEGRRASTPIFVSRPHDLPRSISSFDGSRSPRRTFASAFSQMEHYPPSGPARPAAYTRPGNMRREEALQSVEGSPPPPSPRLQRDNHNHNHNQNHNHNHNRHNHHNHHNNNNRSGARSVPTSPVSETRASRVIQRPQSILISRVGGVDTPPSPVSPEEPPPSLNHLDQNHIMRRQQQQQQQQQPQRLDVLRHVAPPIPRTYSDTSSMGSMDAQASTTSGPVADDINEIPPHSRGLLSFVESRAQITDIENQLDRLHARMMMGTRHREVPRDYRASGVRQATPRSYTRLQHQAVPQRPSRRETFSALDETDRTWSSVASVTSATTDNSLEVHVSRTPDPLLPPPSRTLIEYSSSQQSEAESTSASSSTPAATATAAAPQSEASSTTTSSPASQPLWSLANSVQDIETELAHLSEGTARRSAELASLSQQLEHQTRQYAAEVGNRDPDILGRASEGLRRLRELRERRELGDGGGDPPQELLLAARRAVGVWGNGSGSVNGEDEEYISPVSALFQRSWEAYTRRQQLEQEAVAGRRHDPVSAWFDPAPASASHDGGGGDASLGPLVGSVSEVVTLLRNFRESLGGDQAGPVDRAVEVLVQLRGEMRRREGLRRLRPRGAARGSGGGMGGMGVGMGGRTHWEQPKGLDDDETRPPPVEEAQLRLDCECKICFGQVADTLLLPCSHLVLCGWCANQMGVSKGTEFSPRMVQCPVCRAEVLDRIKVFRG